MKIHFLLKQTLAVLVRSDCDLAESAENCSIREGADRAATSSAVASDEVNALAAMDLVDSIHEVDTPFFVNPNPEYRNRVVDVFLALYGQSLSIEMLGCHFRCHRFHYYD